MLNRRMRNLAVTGMTIVSATVLSALFATGASATVTATANPGHASVAATTVTSAAPAAANASATSNSSATPYYICNTNGGTGGLGCIDEPGHNNLVYVRYVRNITLSFVNEETADGYAFYELQYTGTNECLNYNPNIGFVGEDSCIPGDPNELWEHHYGDLLGNLTVANELGLDPRYTALSTCNDTGNSRLVIFPLYPPGCKDTTSVQYDWLTIAA